MKRVLLLTVAGLFVASGAMAANEQARFALHAKNFTTKSTTICTTYSPMTSATPCTGYTVQRGLGIQSHVYLVIGFADAIGFAGVDFGIDYTTNATGQGLLLDWTLCADGNEYPSDPNINPPGWPAPGSANIVTWLTCQQTVIAPAGVHGAVGAFYVYSYENDVLEITPNFTKDPTIGPVLAIAVCGGASTDLIGYWTNQGRPEVVDLILGKVGFGSGVGYNPCLTTPVAATTWGKIKSQYTTD